MPGFLDTGLNWSHVDDVAEGHLAALKRGTIGERYILSGENVLFADMLAEIAQLVGRHPPRWRFPRRSHDRSLRRGNKRPIYRTRAVYDLNGIRMADHRMFFTAAKAERDLGFRARPYRAALEDAIGWFEAAGYLNGKRERQAGRVGVSAERVARSTYGGDAVGVAKRGKFFGIAITRRRAGKSDRHRRMQVDFDDAGREPTKQRGDAILRHCSGPRQAEHRIGGRQSGLPNAASQQSGPRRHDPADAAPRLRIDVRR